MHHPRKRKMRFAKGLDSLSQKSIPGSVPFTGAERLGPAVVGIASLREFGPDGWRPSTRTVGKYGENLPTVDYVAGMAKRGSHPAFSPFPKASFPAASPLNLAPCTVMGLPHCFLSEVCGMRFPPQLRDTKVRKALELAVTFTVAAQNNEGGFQRVRFARSVCRCIRNRGPDDGSSRCGLYWVPGSQERYRCRCQVHQGLSIAG